MKFTAKQIADLLEGSIVGNPDEEVFALSKIEEGKVGSLSFLSNPKYNSYVYSTKASVLIVNNSFTPEKEINVTLIKVPDAYIAFTTLLEFYNEVKNNKTGREHPYFFGASSSIGKNEYLGAFSYVGENVKIGDNVKIYPNVFIGDNTTVGDNCILYAGVKVYSETIIGNNCILHAGVVLGSDGFGFAPNTDGDYKKIPQTGNVVIEDCVDIGAATTIDRATLGSTIIRSGVKLDNQIQIAHNVEIGNNTVIAAQTGIAGSSKIGKNCMIGGQVGVVGHITIGNNVKIGAQAGITKNTHDNEVVNGTPAFNINDFNKSYVLFRNLPKMAATVNKLEKKLKTQNEQ